MFISCTYVGGSFGTVIVFPLCGWILDKLDWEAVFYITGVMGVGWYLFWFFLGTDHVQMTKVFWRLKVNWKNFSTKIQKYFTIHFTCSESCALSKVNYNQRKSIGSWNS